MRGRRGVRDMHDYPPAGWSLQMPTPNVFEYRDNAGPTHDLTFNADELQFRIACVGLDFFADMAGDCSLVRRFCSPKVRESEIKGSSFRRFYSPKVRKSDDDFYSFLL